jgi:cytochrome c-type biogenesis protein CcmE
MSEIAWEKAAVAESPVSKPAANIRTKFMIVGFVILAAVAALVISGTVSGARFFITINELVGSDKYVGQVVRVTGAVDGQTIKYDEKNLIIEFTVAHVGNDGGDLALALHNAVKDPNAARMNVRVEGQVKPDLLQHEAQAILTGKLDENGVFHATELLLKCPSRFEEAKPENAIGKIG